MTRLYEILLCLYPQEYRDLFGAEMPGVFELAVEERRRRGWVSFVFFVLSEFMGLIWAAGAAWIGRRQPGDALDLTKMRPPSVTRETYVSALDEVINARKLVEFNLKRMQTAISRDQFVEARFFSDEDRRARANLRLVLRKYNIAE
jgi:hypothetical protein